MNRVTVLLTCCRQNKPGSLVCSSKTLLFHCQPKAGSETRRNQKKQNQKKIKKIRPCWTCIKSRFTSDVGNLVNDFEKSSRCCRFPQSSHRKDVRAATAVSFGGEPL